MSLALANLVHAQLTPGRVAVTATLPQGPDVGMAYAATERFRINLGVGFTTSRPDNGATQSEFTVRPGVWFVQDAHEQISLVYGGALEFVARTGSAAKGDVGVEAQAGAEYEISKSFTIGAIVGLGYGTGGTSALGKTGSRFGTSGASVVLTWWVL